MKHLHWTVLSTFFFAFSIAFPALAEEAIDPQRDYHSYANVDDVAMSHVYLNLKADFENGRLSGYSELTLSHLNPEATEVVLDTKALEISSVEALAGETFIQAKFTLGETDDDLGAPLTIAIASGTQKIRVHYNTTEASDGLNWASPEQTHDKIHPFMYSLSQSIYGRTWFPHQDTTRIKVTYSADIETPTELLALMTADNDPNTERDGLYHFDMPQPIVPYLIALAIGDFAFTPISERSGIYAEAGIIEAAAYEFADIEKMIQAVEAIYGDYAWGRYDLLIMPPSFPFGGMEHARLSFITPTVITGDRGLVGLISHELAHSWSGNYVTNGTWRDLWLNEGFTSYVENRTVESIFGKAQASMELADSFVDLMEEMDNLEPGEEILAIDLRGQHPDAVFTEIPYSKAQLFLSFLESRVGREGFDKFVKGYFADFAWSTITTDVFETYLMEHLGKDFPGAFTEAEIQTWIHEPGYPDFGLKPSSAAYDVVDAAVANLAAETVKAADIDMSDWIIHQRIHFVDGLPEDLNPETIAEVDTAMGLSTSGNIKLAYQWMLYAAKTGYAPALDARLEQLLTEQGRIAYTKGLYRELLKTDPERAETVYAIAKPTYHPITVWEVDRVFGDAK